MMDHAWRNIGVVRKHLNEARGTCELDHAAGPIRSASEQNWASGAGPIIQRRRLDGDVKAAVHGNMLAGNVRRGIREQETYRLDCLLRRCPTLHRNPRQYAVAKVQRN